MNTTSQSIYLHVPYCRRRCRYCDFLSRPIDGPVPEQFVAALCNEISLWSGRGPVPSVFIGGGTPSLLSDKDLERIIVALANRFDMGDAEITLEANPDDVSREKAHGWHALGINRISLGVQSFDDAALHFLGRRHTATTAYEAARIIDACFENWSMDLIYGALPCTSWPNTLDTARSLGPRHISAYCLTCEPGTPLAQSGETLCDEDALLDQYQQAEAVFSGYDHYEISNFARQGFQCRHNLVYWHNAEYIGIGPGAFSYHKGKRMRNETCFDAYMAAPGQKEEVLELTVYEQQVETLIQFMRLRQGITENTFCARFGVSFMDRFGAAIAALQQRGLVIFSDGLLQPTRQGFYLNNEIGLALVDAAVNPETPEDAMHKQSHPMDGTTGTAGLSPDTPGLGGEGCRCSD